MSIFILNKVTCRAHCRFPTTFSFSILYFPPPPGLTFLDFSAVIDELGRAGSSLLLLLYRQPATLSIWRPCCILHPALSLTLAALQNPFTPVTLGPASPFSTWELQVPRGHFFLLTHQYMQLQLQVEFVMTCPFGLAPLPPSHCLLPFNQLHLSVS